MLQFSDALGLSKDGAAWSFDDMAIDDQEFGTMFVKSPVINFIPWKDREGSPPLDLALLKMSLHLRPSSFQVASRHLKRTRSPTTRSAPKSVP